MWFTVFLNFVAFSPPKVKAQMNFVLIVDGWPMTVNTPRRIPASSVSSVFELFTTTSMEIKLGTFRHSDTLTKVLSYENCVSKTTLCISIAISVKAGWFNMLTTAEQLSSSFSVANMLTRRSYQLCKWFLELCFINNMFAPIKVIQLFIDDGQIKPFTDTHISSVLSDILPCRSGEFLYTLPPTLYMFWMDIALLKPTWIYMAFMIFLYRSSSTLNSEQVRFALWAISYFLLKYTEEHLILCALILSFISSESHLK